jgi:DNA-binding response OmpR family regulator
MKHTAKPNLIIVDDSRTALAVMSKRLTAMGYQTVAVDSGAAALDLVQARRFDLMILDMTMPEMSGLAVLAELRSALVTRDLPVLMITARSDPAAAIAALEAGADDHVVKPFDFDLLGARIDRLLDRAARMETLRRANAALDARVAQRAAELENTRASLAAAEAAHRHLERQYQVLNASVWRG